MKTAKELREFIIENYGTEIGWLIIEVIQRDAWDAATKAQLERDEKYRNSGVQQFTYAPFPEQEERQ